VNSLSATIGRKALFSLKRPCVDYLGRVTTIIQNPSRVYKVALKTGLHVINISIFLTINSLFSNGKYMCKSKITCPKLVRHCVVCTDFVTDLLLI